MKNEKWTEDLYLYRMKPAPPKMEDFQEYIALYFAEKDEKYLGWFFHYYEPRLNTIIMETVQETAMQGHFADLKQAYIFGIYKALQKYDISTGVPFLIFKEHYVKNEIDKVHQHHADGLFRTKRGRIPNAQKGNGAVCKI